MAVEPRRRRRFLASIRARATVGAMAVVAVALTAGALLQITVVERHLMDAAESSAALRAISVAEQARTGALPSLIPLADDDTQFVQVVDAGGDVIAASDNLETRRRVVDLQPTADDEDDDESDEDEDPEAVEYDDAVAGTFGDLPVDDGDRWRVVAVEVDTADGPLTVLAGESLEDVESTMATLRRSLILGVPILVGIVGLVTLTVIRRSLRPVDTMRTDLDDITSRALDRRITEPTSDDEIASLALAMNDLLDRLQASTASQRQFVGDASHELRSPLAALRTQLDVALAHPDRTDWVATVREAIRDTERVEALASDLLTLARLDEETPDRVGAPVDLGELVADTVEHRGTRPPVRIQTRLEPDVVVRGRANQLARLVRNLLDNAERHATAAVTVRVSRADGRATIEVTDDGPGIPIADRERIFERFTRLDEARTRDAGGAGLGLAIVREVARSHGGTIEVSGPPGATFRVNLPLEATVI